MHNFKQTEISAFIERKISTDSSAQFVATKKGVNCALGSIQKVQYGNKF